MKLKYPQDVLHVHATYLPIPGSIGEIKSKPAQMSIQGLRSSGIVPDFVLARSEREVDEKRKEKIAIACGLQKEDILSAPDVEFIYRVPVNLEDQGFSDKILRKLSIKPRTSDLKEWRKMVERMENPKKTLKIAMVGKYFSTGDFTLSDAYLSVIESIKHACTASDIKAEISWIDSAQIEEKGTALLKSYDGIVVPGGYGARAVEGILQAIRFARENKVPYFGLCYGMQQAAIEFARNVLGLKQANTTEIDSDTKYPVVHVMKDQKDLVKYHKLGGTQRLGAWEWKAKDGTTFQKAYQSNSGFERHRHRYEFNNDFRDRFEKEGMVVSATTKDGYLVEALEIKNHPFFVGTQFHPELKSRPLNPHPLYSAFINACLNNSFIK